MQRRAGIIAAAAGAAALALAVSGGSAPSYAAEDTAWQRVGTGITGGVSGITADPAGGWLVVRDNKAAGQNRVALLSDAGGLRPLAWPGTAPSDLEAVDVVPGAGRRFAVVTSAGSGRVVEVGASGLRVVRSFTLPEGRTQNEGFALARVGTRTVAVWGNRGSTTSPGRLFAATFDAANGSFGAVARATVGVPFPTADVRHVSDVELLGGRVLVSSASDPGNAGPFASAVHDVGTVGVAGGRATLSVGPVRTLDTYPGHKVEGIACAGGAGRLGSDDESLGGSVAAAGFC